ncbi:primosomal protein N' [Clostridium sp.]|uniref:primosomal protein N' n=1 Tax=Clostridium sp. TaxID=1506 RepID=UPI0039914D6C
MDTYADIVVNNEAVSIDRIFTYKVKDDMKDKIKIGHRVTVPFGIKNKPIEGFVFNIYSEEKNDNIRYKYIKSICDKEPLLDRENFLLIEFLRRKYLCKYIDALRVMIPPKIMSGNKEKTKNIIVFNKYIEELNDNQKKALEEIKNYSGGFNKAELTRNFGISTYMLNKLESLGAIKTVEVKVDRSDYREYESYPAKKLTPMQEDAYDSIMNTNKISLLKGVTGSGKTEVYMNLVSYMLMEGKSSVILVPEIALTPQIIERFKGRFGKDVAVFHSKLSDGERYDEWQRVKRGDVKLVIGARSAIFLPFKDLGLIIIDEEHESSYKSDMNPKYNTIEVASYMYGMRGCKVVLGSATPSLESFYKAITKEYNLVELTERVNNKKMPEIHVVDMREELKNNNKSMFSRDLYFKIKDRLEKKEQVILFLNRRGYSTFVSCRSCGFVYECESCDIAMTYHKNGFLVCHYCGKTKKIESCCPKCKSKYIKYFGTGTEKVEQAVKHYFKDAKTLRMDVDTTRKKNSYEEIYNSFKRGEADILIGTQMVAKGFDFENVTLVGVIAADTTLNLPDYRASEKNFQIITQVSGRAGRGEKKGEVIVQSYSPEHYSLQAAALGNYEEFFKKEIEIRKAMDYPPFSKLMVVNISGTNYDKIRKVSKEIYKVLKKSLNYYNNNIIIYEPCSSIVGKIKDMYRWQVLLKGDIDDINAEIVKNSLYEISKDIYNEVRVTMDINPNNLI